MRSFCLDARSTQEKRVLHRKGTETRFKNSRDAAGKVAEHLTRLQKRRVRPATQCRYVNALGSLLVWHVMTTLPRLNAETWDELMSDYLEHMFDIGRRQIVPG